VSVDWPALSSRGVCLQYVYTLEYDRREPITEQKRVTL
jgi:hypothetical protein